MLSIETSLADWRRQTAAGLAGYCATKGGVRLFVKAVAMECATAGDGIRVNTVHPGVIDTPIWTKSPASAGNNAPIDPNEVARSGYRLAKPGKLRMSQMTCSFSPPTRPATWRVRNS
jgi:NAD(P)-dependent dehydrogenase (short-subunit alcohol dehydrogenase family)